MNYEELLWETGTTIEFPTSLARTTVNGVRVHLFAEIPESSSEPVFEMGVEKGRWDVSTDIGDVEWYLPRRYWPPQVWAGQKFPPEKRTPLPALVEAVNEFLEHNS